MAESHIDEVIQTTKKPRQSLVNRPSVTADDFKNVLSRPSLVASIEGSLRDINGALDELTGKGGKKNSGWRQSMRKQVSTKLGGKAMLDDTSMDGIGEDEEYDYGKRGYDDSYGSDDMDINSLQKELNDADANSEYSREASKDDEPSVIEGDLDNFDLEDMEVSPTGVTELKSTFIDSGDKPAVSIGGEETAASTDSESAGERKGVPPEIKFDNDSNMNDDEDEEVEVEQENTEESQTKAEEKVSDHEYEIGMHQVKYRALEEKMVASQAESSRMFQEQSQELEEEKKAKSMLELQFLKLQQDYDRLYKEKEELYKMNKLQQKAILELQSKQRK